MNSSALPCGQTPISKPAASTISTTSKAKTAPSGSSLPSRISSVLAGVSWSWSKVPAWRSFTIETAVSSVVRKESTKPNVPATMKGVPSKPGLKSARVTTATPPPGAGEPAPTPASRRAVTSLATSCAPVARAIPAKKASVLPASTASAPS